MMTSESGGASPRHDLAARPAAGRRERQQGGGSSADVGADVPARQCFIADCPSSTETSPGKVFFELPAERDRCQQWLKICKREDLIGMPTPCIDSYVICSDHFIKGYFKDASKAVLKNLAVPTLFDTVFIGETEQAEESVENEEFEVAETDEEYDDADGDFDSRQLCRLCGSHSQNVIYIFSATGSNLKIASKINSILPITVDSSDHLPKQVCLSCVTKLDTSKDLFETCLRVDERLKYLARKKLFRSHPCNKDSQAGTSHCQNSIKKENVEGVDRSVEYVDYLPTNDQHGKVTSGTCNSDSRKGNCDLISEVVVSDSYICPFNCGGAMVAKSDTLDCENEENKNVVVKDGDVTGETTVTRASDESNSLVPRNSVTVSEISPNVVYELRDDHGRKYTMSEPIPEWWHRGANIDNLEIIIHTLDPNFKLEDDEAHAEAQEVKKVDTKAYQVSYEAFPNLQLLAEHSKGHADSTCLCSLCMVRFESTAELASHMAGHRGNDKKMTKIAGSRRFGCSLCLRKFNNEKTWRRHSCNPNECKPIRCPICMKAFQTEERLAFHQKFHNGAKPNYCEKCSKHFDNESLLYYHCSLVHEGDRPYACNICKKRFFSNTRLTAHKRVHTGERPYECKECKSRFYDQETLKRHYVTHMSIKPFQCELCGILCGRKSLLRQHIQVHHLTPDHLKRGHSLIHYYCKLCDKTFTGSRDVLTHRDTHWHVDKQVTGEIGSVSSAPPLVCEFCAECFSDLSILAKHRKETHGDEKPYICSVCKLSSHTLHEARVHRRTHTTVDGTPKATSEDVTAKENTFMCEECGMQLSGGGNLRAHLKLHKQEALHKCGKCDRTFSNKHKLSLHSRLHSGEKPFACQQCGKRFSQSSALHIHILLHTGEKPHLCDLCGASFRIKADRDNHRRTHTGEKPYRCEYCFKEFRTGQVYYQHRMIHTGERRFPCDVCGKAFKRSHTLVVHKRIHTGEKPNICDICGKGFRQRTDMRKHRALHAHR